MVELESITYPVILNADHLRSLKITIPREKIYSK